jgi:hypothetical protein
VVSRKPQNLQDDDLQDLEPQDVLSVYESLKTLGHDDKWIADTLSNQFTMNPWQNSDTILHSLFHLVNGSEAWGRKDKDYHLPETWSKTGGLYPKTTLKWSFLQAFDTKHKTEYDDLTTPMTRHEKEEIMEKVNKSNVFVINRLVAHLHLMSHVVDVYEKDTLGREEGTYRNIHLHCLTDPSDEQSLPYPFKMPLNEDFGKAANEHRTQIVNMLQGKLEYEIPDPHRNLRADVVLGKCHYHWWNQEGSP